MAKKNPNPNGKKGGKEHQKLQSELFEQIKSEVSATYQGSGNLEIDTEVPIQIYTKKRSRIADIAAFAWQIIGLKVEVLWLRIAQIGRTDSKGKPVAREKEAIEDIEKATGIEVEFHDYRTKKRIK